MDMMNLGIKKYSQHTKLYNIQISTLPKPDIETARTPRIHFGRIKMRVSSLAIRYV
jgi:hypothetical protein